MFIGVEHKSTILVGSLLLSELDLKLRCSRLVFAFAKCQELKRSAVLISSCRTVQPVADLRPAFLVTAVGKRRSKILTC